MTDPDKFESKYPDVAASQTNNTKRQQAELILQENQALLTEDVLPLSAEATRALLHELRVHQIELEMQNQELRDSQAALDQARERYFNLYELAPVSYCVLNQMGIITQANLTAASLFGVTRRALLARPLSRYVAKVDQDVYFLHQKRMVEQCESQSFELRMVKSNGDQFWVQVESKVGHDNAGLPEFRKTLVDITERKLAEQERALMQETLIHKNTELEQAKSAAEKASRVKSDFLTAMSHELRTPLHAILGFGQLMTDADQVLTTTQQSNIDQILGAGWHLLGLVNEVLDLAHIESGELTLTMESISLPELISECEILVRPIAQQRDVAILHHEGDFPCRVMADRRRCAEVLTHLLTNGIKYNRRGGSVTINYRATGAGRIRVSVTDTGAGLPEDKLGELFQPFYRIGQNVTSEAGIGIGLAFSKRLIELMGGTIGVQSHFGSGSVFWIELARSTGAPALPTEPPLVV